MREGAARALVEAVRYPFAPKAKGLGEAQVWGITGADYLRVADPWPLNPKGELMPSVSIEDRQALASAAITTSVPGLAFADWGPGDMRFSLGLVNVPADVSNPASTAVPDQARSRVLAACKAANLAFSESMILSNMADQLCAGVLSVARAYTRNVIAGGPHALQFAARSSSNRRGTMKL